MIERERDVNVAKSNIDASKVALDEAKQFRSDAGDEVKAAKEQHEAAAEDLKAADKQGTAGDVQQLENHEQKVVAVGNAKNAKKAYGDQLVDLRKAQVDNAESEHELMEARLSRAQYELLRRTNSRRARRQRVRRARA